MSSTLRRPLPGPLPAVEMLAKTSDPVGAATAPKRPRGRPPLATREQVIEELRDAARAGTLFRVHLARPALYARARRLWVSWAGALRAAGIDYRQVVEQARRRSLETRRTKRAPR